MDIKKLSDGITKLSEEAAAFFDAALAECGEKLSPSWMDNHQDRSTYWDKLTHENRLLSQKTQETLLKVISLIIPTLKASPVLNESDEKDVGLCVKRMRAALKLRRYRSWDTMVLHDEGRVLGVNPPGHQKMNVVTQMMPGRLFLIVSNN
jgi:hypothetical protein